MLCYYYPPVATSGMVRSVGFAQMLNQFGWEPLVLTVKNARDINNAQRGAEVPAGIEVVRTTELNLDGVINLLQGSVNRVPRTLRLGAARQILSRTDRHP